MRPLTRQSPLDEILAAANQVVLGKSRQTRLPLCCLLARGHLLIEDLPGVGTVSYTHLDVYKRQAIHGKALGRAGDEVGPALDVAGGVLDADDIRNFGQAQRGVVAQILSLIHI